jgi:hypothetical protein
VKVYVIVRTDLGNGNKKLVCVYKAEHEARAYVDWLNEKVTIQKSIHGYQPAFMYDYSEFTVIGG